MTGNSALAEREDVRRAFESLRFELPADASADQFIVAARQLMDRYGGADAAAALDGIRVVPVNAGGVDAEYLVPANPRSDRRIVYLHGGAWIGGGFPVYRPLGAVLARLSGCAVLVVAYRLAPENPYPAPLDDSVAAFEWACETGPDGPSPADVSVAGDSAGANLAAALCVRAITGGARLPVRLALLCGVLDVVPSDYVARHDPLSGPDSLAASAGLYTQGLIALDDPLISPGRAADDVLAKFPPTLIQASADEHLVDGSRRLAERLIAVGGRSVLSVWPLMPHSWHCFLDTLPESPAALSEVAAFLVA